MYKTRVGGGMEAPCGRLKPGGDLSKDQEQRNEVTIVDVASEVHVSCCYCCLVVGFQNFLL